LARFVLWGAGMYGHHDSHAQYVFERPENAQALLLFALPRDFAGRVDWTTLRLERSTFTHPALRAALGDLLYSVQRKDTGQTAQGGERHAS
jgi:predicted transposase YdaD